MDYPKTVKRYNLELNSKEKRGSKLCPNNYIKLCRWTSKITIKNYEDKEIKINYTLSNLGIKRIRFFELLNGYKKDPNSFSIQYNKRTINRKIDKTLPEPQ